MVSSFKLITELTAEGFGVSFLYAAVVGDDPRFGRFSCPPLTGAHELNAVFLKHTDAGRPRPEIPRADGGLKSGGGAQFPAAPVEIWACLLYFIMNASYHNETEGMVRL